MWHLLSSVTLSTGFSRVAVLCLHRHMSVSVLVEVNDTDLCPRLLFVSRLALLHRKGLALEPGTLLRFLFHVNAALTLSSASCCPVSLSVTIIAIFLFLHDMNLPSVNLSFHCFYLFICFFVSPHPLFFLYRVHMRL